MSKITSKGFEKRKAIVEKATTLMNEVDFEHLTVRMICDAADISIGTFYHYFDEKYDLIVELFGLVDQYLEETVIPTLTSKDELVNIVRFCRGFAEYVTICGTTRSKLINSMYPNYEKNSREIECKRPLFSEMKTIIIRGQKQGQIDISLNPDDITDMLIVMLRGYCFDWARRGGSYNLEDKTIGFAELFVKVLKPNPLGLYGLSTYQKNYTQNIIQPNS